MYIVSSDQICISNVHNYIIKFPLKDKNIKYTHLKLLACILYTVFCQQVTLLFNSPEVNSFDINFTILVKGFS